MTNTNDDPIARDLRLLEFNFPASGSLGRRLEWGAARAFLTHRDGKFRADLMYEVFRDLVSTCITQHVDQHALDVLRVAEQSEREILEKLARKTLNE